MKRISALLISALLFILLPVTVSAAGAVNMNRSVSLDISFAYEEEKLQGASFDIYLISTMDNSGELTPTDAFKVYEKELDIRGKNDEAWIEVTQTLERAIRLGEIDDVLPADTAKTNESGIAAFPSENEKIIPGLYLVMGTTTSQGGYIYETDAFMVKLPNQDVQKNTWEYQLEVNAKSNQRPILDDYTVIKIWEDECHKEKRPETIEIQLLCDGEEYENPITLPQEGKWEYTWEDLDVNHYWTVTENVPKGYHSKVEQEGNCFVVTNTCERVNLVDEPDESKLPQTGQLWWPVPMLVSAGLLLIVIGLIRRRGASYEE